jgi:MtN3 and saliva related transmembrane protein
MQTPPTLTEKEKKAKKGWEAVGLTATTLSTVCFIPPLVEAIIDPGHSSIYDFPLYIVNGVSNVFWVAYGVYLKSFPLVLSSAITIAISIVYIFLISFYNPQPSSSSVNASSSSGTFGLNLRKFSNKLKAL